MKQGSAPPVMLKAYIWRSAKNFEVASGLPGFASEVTDTTIDFSSISMPALAAACFTMAWFFWRRLIDLVEHLQPLAVLRADPVGAPLPAGLVEDGFALSTLNSQRSWASEPVGAFRSWPSADPGGRRAVPGSTPGR